MLVAGAIAVAAYGLVWTGGSPPARHVRHRAGVPAAPTSRKPAPARTPAQTVLGLPPVKPGPVPGYVLIADRNNNRILLVSPGKRVVWEFPRPGDIRPGQSFHDPDDAFFTPGYTGISINEEFNQTISLIHLRSHRIVWSYGHAGVAGSGAGYLSNPDDAYLLPNGLFMVADIRNCRVLLVDRARKVVRELGRAGSCGHDPPQGLSSPNGATPLPDGGVLVTEIGGWVDRISASGRLLYSVRTPTTYPSDAQLLPDGNILVAGFDTPGRVDEITAAGTDRLDVRAELRARRARPPFARHPLAERHDRRHRRLAPPRGRDRPEDETDRLVVRPRRGRRHRGRLPEQAGRTRSPARRFTAGERSRHRAAPARSKAKPPRSVPSAPVRRVGSLPQALSRASAVALPDGRVLVVGGLTGGSSTDQILLGTPGALRPVGRLPIAGHDAAAALLGRTAYVFGGGQAASTNTVIRVNTKTGAAALAAKLDEPLSDLGAAVVRNHAYLVGGYTGAQYASAVLRYDGGGKTTTVARLPTGLRYAGVAALGDRIYVAGGLTAGGETAAIYRVDPIAGTVRRIGQLPAPTAYGALVAYHGALYLIGGKTAAGAPDATVLRIDPQTGTTTAAARLPRGLAEPAAVALADRIVVIGGENSNAVYELTPR